MNAAIDALNAPELGPHRPGGPWLRRVGSLNVLKVKGSFREMGRQHGQLLADSVHRGPMPYYRTYLERLFGHAGYGPAAKVLWPVLNAVVGRRIGRSLPPFVLDTLEGLSEGSGLPMGQLMAGATMPDALCWFTSALLRLKRPGPAVAHRASMALGCTSALAWGDATRDGKLLHARNFDYHGVESWAGTATVAFHQPDEGMRFVSVCAAGVPLGGVTAMNEAGLTLTVHQHMFTDRSALGGTPIGLVGDIIMRSAHDLEEAQAILAQHRPIGCWTYVIADGHRREVLLWEENPQRNVAIRVPTERGTAAYTNIYFDEELGATEAELYGSYWRHNRSRLDRARHHLAAGGGGGSIDAQAMSELLGDVGDPSCRIHAAVAMLLTVGSVIFRPEDGVFWVGTGDTPTSHGPFRAFDLRLEGEAEGEPTLDGGRGQDPSALEAFDAYRQAYLAWFDLGDVGASRRHLGRALELQPDQPGYALLAGLLAMQAGDAPSALGHLERAATLGHTEAPRRATAELWRARAQDLMGRREVARAGYRRTLELPGDAPVLRAARKGLERPFTRRRAARVVPDFAFADVMSP